MLTSFVFLLGIAPQLVVTILSADENENTRTIGKVYLDWLFLAIFPNYSMGKGISDIYNNYAFNDLCLNKLPESFEDILGQKASLDEICDFFKDNGGTFPCCKSE